MYTHYVTHSSEEFNGEKCDAYEVKAIAEATPMEGQKLGDHSFILRVMGHLLGKVLTTVEASTPNVTQAKAIKDLMRGHFSQEMELVGGFLFDQNVLNRLAEESMEGLKDEDIVSVTIDEVLGLEVKE